MNVIYTEATKETDPIGGIWSSEPFALRHVAWVPLEDHDAVVEALETILALHIAHHNTPEHVAARAALAKAEGRTDQ